MDNVREALKKIIRRRITIATQKIYYHVAPKKI